MLTLAGVGFYSDMVVKVFGDTAGDVDEVISPRFLFLSSHKHLDCRDYSHSN